MLIIISVLLASSFLAVFWFALRKNQFEDMNTPAMRILFDDDENNKIINNKEPK